MNSRTDSIRVEAPRSRQRDVLPSSLTEARHPKWIRAFCLSTLGEPSSPLSLRMCPCTPDCARLLVSVVRDVCLQEMEGTQRDTASLRRPRLDTAEVKVI